MKRTTLIVVLLLVSVAGGGGGFLAVRSGAVEVPGGASQERTVAGGAHDWVAPRFVALDPLTVSLGPEARADHLRIALALEVAPGSEQAVAHVTPRIFGVLNTFLRAVDERDVELPRAMERLRAQMLRRVQLVAPPGAVRDLLVQEFILK